MTEFSYTGSGIITTKGSTKVEICIPFVIPYFTIEKAWRRLRQNPCITITPPDLNNREEIWQLVI